MNRSRNRDDQECNARGADASGPGATGAAGLAQLVEHVICNHGVGGSNPSAGTKLTQAKWAFYGNN
jgi:hypothetical protein